MPDLLHTWQLHIGVQVQTGEGVYVLVQEVMVHLCGGDQPILPKTAVLSGTRSLLNTMGVEDVISNCPNAADWVRRFACMSLSCIHALAFTRLALGYLCLTILFSCHRLAVCWEPW